MAVTYERTPAGIRVSRLFQSLGAAAAGADALERVVEAAFSPAPFPTTDSVRDLTPAEQALLDRQDEEAPLEGLTAGKALNLPRVDEGS